MADITGTPGDDTIHGTDQADNIDGGAGNDTIYGHEGDDWLKGSKFDPSGNDILDGGEGADLMEGGPGDDTYYVDNANDQIVDGAGFNRVLTSISYVLAFDQNIDLFETTDANGTDAIDLTGNNFGQTIIGNAGDNIITGGFSADTLIGGDGNDTLTDSDEAAFTDIMRGGLGDDIYVYSTRDIIEEFAGEGTDTVIALRGYTAPSGLSIEIIRVSSTEPVTFREIRGNEIDQTIYGHDGDGVDRLFGGGGDDHIYGFLGDDTLNGDEGADILEGGGGNDTLTGGMGADTLEGGSGNDTYFLGSDGMDTVIEAAGQGEEDTVHTSAIFYTLPAGLEIEVLRGNGTILLVGNEFGQLIVGDSNFDELRGLGGNDILDGGTGEDSMDGGQGNDTFLVDHVDDNVIEDAGEGDDRVTASVSYALDAGVSVETMGTSAPAGTTALNLTGNEVGQSIYGNAGNNVLNGLAGNDYLVGQAGNDTLDGGDGADNMRGGTGNDVYRVDNLADAVFEVDGEGDDRLIAVSSFALDAGVSVETLGTTAPAATTAINLTGNEFGQSIYGNAGDNGLRGLAGNDYLVGGAGNDLLDGGTGADNLRGEAGNDVYFVDSLGDQVFETAGGGDDAIVTTLSYTLAAGLDIETLAVAASADAVPVSLTGNELGQTLYGGSANNFLSGGGGDDSLQGLAGEDLLIGGLGQDNLRGGSGSDRFAYASAAESTAAARDAILDFAAGELIDLAAIDAGPGAGDQAFSFIGSNAFSNTAGELRAVQSGGVWTIEGDVDGNGQADLVIAVTTADADPITAGDFVL